jgi:hypothetical protein
VEEFVIANKSRDKQGLMEFINLKLGEVWEEVNPNADDWEHLHRRREYYPANDILPEGVLLLTAGVDVQHDRLECTVYGWGLGRECWGIQHQIIYGKPDDSATWQQLDALLHKTYPMANGSQLTVSCACVDSGDGAYTTNVYQYTKGFIHSKTLVIDDEIAIIGSANLDLRSFEQNFEVSAFIYDEKHSKSLKELFIKDMKACKKLSYYKWSHRPKYRKFIQALARLLSPIL